MWSNNSPPPSPHAEPTDSLSLSLGPPSFRRKRTKTRKPKFLSLRHQLTPQLVKPPLSHYHPPDLHDDHNVAFLFSSDGGATSTLSGLLQDDSFSPPSLTWPTLDGDNGSSLVRKAMRRSKEEREGSEEMWLCYSDVTSYCSSSSAIMKEEVCICDCDGRGMSGATTFSCLSLKLDYRGILSAWSDKGSPYVALQTPQHLPPLLHHVLPANSPKVSSDGNENSVVENAWEVVENEGKMEVKDKKLWEREASLLRYKQKKQHRRFAKRVRYEVRKLNADKRPRVKGRFVTEDREV